jgi:DNA-binding GntR family transcriptional regulator
MANEFERLKDEIMALLSAAPDLRLRPHEVERGLAHRLGVSMYMVQEAIRVLAEEGRLVFTYRDPTSYIEIPAPGEPARPAA